MNSFCMAMHKLFRNMPNTRGGGAGGAGGGALAPPSFGDLFSKYWEFFENPFFAIYYSPPIKNLLPPTLLLLENNYLNCTACPR